MGKNKQLEEFTKYCLSNKDMRFWQCLRGWSKSAFILKSTHFDPDMFNHKYMEKNNVHIKDTYYEDSN